jgi:DNA polymerase I-like protein with 3'-5' exonuclease and polymerase domains
VQGQQGKPALNQALEGGGYPVVDAFLKIRSLVPNLRMLERWLSHIAPDGRIHPLISVSATTGRTSSTAPSGQNFPHAPAFRAIIKAGSGKVIVSADYGQIELRIAAASAARELTVVEQWLEGRRDLSVPPWIRRALEDGRNRYARRDPPPLPANPWSELTYSYYQVLVRGQTMAAIFKEGLDPHLLTALAMAARAGTINLAGLAAIDFLRNAEQQALRTELATERRGARGTNFGMLFGQGVDGLHRYGIRTYGLAWSQQEAAIAREQWLELYPELRWWQAWTTHSMRLIKHYKLMMISDEGAPTVEERSLWKVHTLTGRRLIAPSRTAALNYQIQGAEADLICTAMAKLPEPARGCLINIIHDELLFEVPADQAEMVRLQVIEAMTAAGDAMLGAHGLPIEIEATIGESWCHE